MDISIRTFEKNDIEFALARTEREGWDPTADLFETCLAHDPNGCFIAAFANEMVDQLKIESLHSQIHRIVQERFE